jgi:hypothetical protein
MAWLKCSPTTRFAPVSNFHLAGSQLTAPVVSIGAVDSIDFRDQKFTAAMGTPFNDACIDSPIQV